MSKQYMRIIDLPIPCKPEWRDKANNQGIWDRWLETIQPIRWYERSWLLNFWRIKHIEDGYEQVWIKFYKKRNGVTVILDLGEL